MNAVRIGLVGCGRMGRVHLAAGLGVSEIQVVAVCDPVLNSSAPPSQIVCPILTFEKLLELPDVEAVLIAASTPVHEQLVRASLDHGKHVLCEKPLTLDPDTDLKLEVHAAARGRLLQIGFWRRFAEPYLRLRHMLSKNYIGNVKAIRTAQWDAVPPTPDFCDPRVSGGIEIDCGVHEFDLARWLLNAEVDSVAACSPPPSTALGAVADVDTIYGLARLSANRTMTVDLTRTGGHRDSIRTEVIGERGSIVVEFTETGTIVVRSNDERHLFGLAAHDVISDALRSQLRAFADAVRTGQLHPDAATANDSHYALIAARALREARRDGTWHLLSL